VKIFLFFEENNSDSFSRLKKINSEVSFSGLFSSLSDGKFDKNLSFFSEYSKANKTQEEFFSPLKETNRP